MPASSSIYLICNLSDHCHSGIDRAYDRIGPSGCFLIHPSQPADSL